MISWNTSVLIVFVGIGVFALAVGLYDYFTRKHDGRERK